MRSTLHSVRLVLLAASLAAAYAGETWLGESLDLWHGYVRHNFTVDGSPAWVVEPKQAARGNPWTWCMEFPDAFTERIGVLQLLEKGFHHVHIAVGNTHGCPAAVKHFDAFYKVLQAGGLAKKGTLIVEQRYQALGGTIAVIHKPGGDHHPHGLADPQPIVDFILEHAR